MKICNVGMNRFLVCFLLLLCGALLRPAAAESRKGVDDFFVQLECARPEILEGDSCLVTVRVYSLHPIAEVEKIKFPKVKGCRVAPRSVRMVQRRVRRGRTVYYTVDAAQVYVCPEEVGTFRIPECKVAVQVRCPVRGESVYEPFFGLVPKYKAEKRTAQSESIKIAVCEVPLKTTEELLKSGKNVF